MGRGAGLMIRQAELQDRFHIVRMAGVFLRATEMPMPFDPAHAEASAKEWMAAPDKLALVLDLGGVCGVLMASCAVYTFSPVLVASEQGFWIDPRARGRWGVKMIAAYERWAKEQGAVMAGLATLHGKSAGALYQRLGYAPSETHYWKAL